MGLKKQFVSAILLGSALTAPLFAQDIATPSSSIDTLAIFSFNDFHGAFASDGITPGAARLVQMTQNEKQRYPHSIVVSGGDNFSGSYFSKITKGEPIKEMYEAMDVEMSAIGNHEFDWGLSYLVDTAALNIPHVAANITEEKRYTHPNWLSPYRIVERKLKDGSSLRIAFIGLTTTDTYVKTKPENLKGLQFTHPLGAACIQTVYQLKKEGRIDMIILLMHIGTDMKMPYRITEENAQGLPFIDKVDAIISAHSHELVLDKINNIPIIQAGVNGTHIGKLLFQIQDFNGHRDISFIQGDTVRVACEENPEMREAVEKIMDKYRLNEKLATAKEALIHDRTINKFDYTPIGALVTAAYAQRFQKEMPAYKDQPVIGVNHYGGIRAALPKGDITRLRAGNILPFGSAIVAYRFDGKRLKKLLEDGRKNPNGFLQSSDLTLTLSGNKIEKIVYTRDGQKTEIEDNTPCVVTLDAFITDGGDGYDASLFKGYEIPEFDNLGIISTDAFMDYLKGFKKPITVESTHMPVISK